MNVIAQDAELTREIRLEQEFAVYVLGNQHAEVAVIPELGARLLSLKDASTGREWMWHPAFALRLFRNRLGDEFARSTLVGMDECLPTIAACSWQQRCLPDHGEVWSQPWEVDEAAWQQGILKTTVRLKVSPFTFERTIRLVKNELRLSYRLTNRSATQEHFLWAMHPLLRLRPGDRLALPASTRTLLDGETWVDAVDSAIPKGGCSKLFAGPVHEGWTRIHNAQTGERIEFEWDPAQNNTLGLWLSRGGWHGHHHFAVEPTNGGPDALDVAAGQKRCGAVPPSGTVTWQVRVRVGA